MPVRLPKELWPDGVEEAIDLLSKALIKATDWKEVQLTLELDTGKYTIDYNYVVPE